MQNLWPRIEGLLRDAGRDISRPARYLNHEWGCTYKDDADYHFCMIYPDTYELGQPNQAVRILCNVVNAVDGMYAERGYLPAADMIDLMRREGVPAFSLESVRRCMSLTRWVSRCLTSSSPPTCLKCSIWDAFRCVLPIETSRTRLSWRAAPARSMLSLFRRFSTCFCWAKVKSRFPNCSFFIGK